jgi:hypothetical protein
MRLAGLVLCLLVSFVLPAAAADWLNPKAAYSATRTMRAAGQEMIGPVHHDGGKERFEMTMQGQQQIMIRREDQQRMFMVMPQMGMGMELPLGGPEAMPSAGDYSELQPETLGRETIDGEDVTRYRLVTSEGGQSYTVLIWATDDGIPMRIEVSTAEGGFEMELSDLQRGPQPAELFELPAGIQMMDMPGQ